MTRPSVAPESGRRGARVRRACVCGTALLSLTAVGVTGCGEGKDSRQTEVVTSVTAAQEATKTITPLERGKIRREALAALRPGIDAWVRNDLTAMADYFPKTQMQYFKDQTARYQAEGKARVRVHDQTKMDVVEMNDQGTEVAVEYSFVDNSYFADKNGAKLSQPSAKETVVEFTAVKSGSDWKIRDFFAGKEALQ